jgi:thiol-disulfide isomerase/thioredoxin
MSKTTHQLFLLILLACLLSCNSAQIESQQHTVEILGSEEINFTVYGKSRQQRILWLGPNYGIQERHKQAAKDMAKAGMEVWLTNLAEGLFLPAGAETMRNIPNDAIADLVEKLSDKGKYEVVVMSSGYGGIPVLRGIHTWQNRKQKSAKLTGVILFSPYFYTHVPTLGTTPTFVNIVNATNIPVYIFQDEKNGNRGHLPAMLSALQQNAPVYTEIMKGTTFIFYDEDKAPETFAILKSLPKKIARAIDYLSKHDIPASTIDIPDKESIARNSGLNVELTPYKGKVRPEPLALLDATGKNFTLNDYKGKVTLVNFWASWCTPCIEEIPSLNRLKTKMQGKPFQLVSINYAETPGHIKDFMKKVKVDFPVLLDADGNISKKWKVVAFPSTFVIGVDGKIHYGVNAAIHWDTDKVIQQLEGLMN